MEKRFTSIGRNIRLWLFLCPFISIYVSAVSAEYKSMIRHDRVWECLSLECGDNYIKCMKIDGSEEINGHTYYRLVSFRKTRPIYDSYAGINVGYEIYDNITQHEGYIREENGVVYTLVKEWKKPEVGNPYDEFGSHYIPQTKVSNPNPEDVCEYMLFDFNKKAGEQYDALTFLGSGDYSGNAVMVRFSVLSESMIEIEGEECRSVEVACVDPYDGKLYPSHVYIE